MGIHLPLVEISRCPLIGPTDLFQLHSPAPPPNQTSQLAACWIPTNRRHQLEPVAVLGAIRKKTHTKKTDDTIYILYLEGLSFET